VSHYGELTAWSKLWVFRRRQNVCDEEQARMPAGSEFHTEGAAALKPREKKVVWA